MTPSFINPFTDSIVTDPWRPAAIDVPSIHGKVFATCQELLSQVRTTGEPASILIYGAAGSGKTHLLGRLRTAIAGPRTEQPAIFCSIRLATATGTIRRLTRRCLVDDLLRPNDSGVCQLELALLDRLSKHQVTQGNAAATLKGLRTKPDLEAHLINKLERLDAGGTLGHNLLLACRHRLLDRHRWAIGQWFRDGELPDQTLRQLGFVSEPEDEDPEHDAFQFILRLIDLVGPSHRVVFCFDQIEALQSRPDDGEGLFQLGRLVADLFNGAKNTLIVTCAQVAFQDQIKQHIRQADLARVAGNERTIDPLNVKQAEELAAARLDASPMFQGTDQRQTERLWPIGAERLRRFCQSGHVTPRQLIAYCRDVIDAWRTGEPPPDSSPHCSEGEFLRDQYESRREQAIGRPGDSQTATVHGLTCLGSLEIEGAKLDGRPLPRDIDLALEKGDRRVLVSVCNSKHVALATRLKRLRQFQDDLPSNTELVLVRDSNAVISKTAKKTRENWDALTEHGARAVRPTAEALAALEALRTLLADAQAGDLAGSDGQTIQPQTVQEWLRQHLDPELERLMAELVHAGAAVPADDLFDDLLELMQRRHMARITALADETKRTPAEVEACLRGHDAEFGLIGEPAVAAYERILAPSSEGN